MARYTAYSAVLLFTLAGCDLSRFDEMPDVTAFAYRGSCMCALCADRAFCQYENTVTGEVRFLDRRETETCPVVRDPDTGEPDPTFVQNGFSTRTRWLPGGSWESPPIHCVDPDGTDPNSAHVPEVRPFGRPELPERNMFCDPLPEDPRVLGIEDFANVECGADLDRDCERVGTTGCPPPAPEVISCVRCNGNVCNGCVPRMHESPTDPEQLERAMDKLQRQCGELDPFFSGFGEPHLAFPPSRICFLSCIRPRDAVDCSTELFDPPQRSLPAVSARVGVGAPPIPDDTLARIIVRDGDGDVRATRTVHVTGEILLSVPRCGPGDLCDGEVSDVTGRTLEPFTIGDATTTEIRVGSSEVMPVTISPLSPTRSMIEGPPGVSFFLAGDIAGVGTKGQPFAPGVLHGEIDWVSRDFALSTVLTGRFEDGTVAVELHLFGTVPNLPPDADAGPDRTEECTATRGAMVSFSADASTDPDGAEDMASFQWSSRIDGELVGHSGPEVELFLPLGDSVVGLTVRDRGHASTYDEARVAVVDTEPPVFDAIEVATDCLWSPEHTLRLFRLGDELRARAHDVCEGEVDDLRIVSVTSSQPEDSSGDGASGPDVRFGSGAFCVRSERRGPDRSPREYTVTLQATDSGGRASRQSVLVRVPHDMRPGDRCDPATAVLSVADDDPRCVADVPVSIAAAGPAGARAGHAGRPAADAPGGCSITRRGDPGACCLLAVGVLLAMRRRRR